MGWILASLLLMFGCWLIGQGLWIQAKAIAAQWLLQNAWSQTLKTHHPAKPWPWADTWPIGRLLVPQHGIDQIILADASARSLAFGPGRVGNGQSLEGSQTLTLSGHRDTHFSFIRELQPGETISVQTVHGEWIEYIVKETAVLDSRAEQLASYQSEASLLLITCYPFDALIPGGPLRYVVKAEKITAKDSTREEERRVDSVLFTK